MDNNMNNQGQQGAESFNQVQNDVQSQVVNPQDVNQQQYDAQQQYYQQYNQQQYDAQQQYYQQQYDMQQQYYQQQAYDGQKYAQQQAYDGQQYAQQQSYDGQQVYQQAYQQNYQQPVSEGNVSDVGNGDKNNGGKKKTGLIIGIIAAVLVVAAVIVTVIILKNKKDDKKDKDGKTTENVTTADGTEDVTTGDLTTEETTTEEVTTEAPVEERYYELVAIDDGSGSDYSSVLQSYADAGEYSFMVFNDKDKTGYIVIRGELALEFTFDDTSITADGEQVEIIMEGDKLTLKDDDESMDFVSLSPEEFAVMYDAYINVGAIRVERGEKTSETIVFPYEDINVTIPEGYTMIGTIDSEGYTDTIHCQLSDENAGVVASYFVDVDYWSLSDDGKTIDSWVEEQHPADGYEKVDFQSDNGFVINYLYRNEKDSEYMSDAFSENEDAKYCHMIEYFAYFEANDNAYSIILYIDADYYGDDADNAAMALLKGLSYR